MTISPQQALIDALERVQLDPTIAALPPIEQARKAALLILAESAGAPETGLTLTLCAEGMMELEKYRTATSNVDRYNIITDMGRFTQAHLECVRVGGQLARWVHKAACEAEGVECPRV
jgi:hypothetical protein